MSDSSPPREGGSLTKGDHYHHPDLRDAMIRVALDLLESEGPSGWTVRAAARIAGVSSGAPYRHFADKDALLAAVAARGFDELREQIDARMALAAPEPLSRFQALGEAYVGFALARPGRYSIMFGRVVVEPKAHAELREAADRTFAALFSEVERAQAVGLLRSDRTSDELAATAWSTIHGMSDLLLSGRLGRIADVDPLTLTARIGRIMFEGLLSRDK